MAHFGKDNPSTQRAGASERGQKVGLPAPTPTGGLEALSAPRASRVKTADFLAEFRQLLDRRLMADVPSLTLQEAHRISATVATFGADLAGHTGATYRTEREQQACKVLSEGLLPSELAECRGSILDLLLSGGPSEAQRFINRAAADPKMTEVKFNRMFSHLAIFYDLAGREGWVDAAAAAELRNPRARRFALDEFPPFMRRRSENEVAIARGEMTRLQAERQETRIHDFLEKTLKKAGITFNPAAERAAFDALRTRGQSFDTLPPHEPSTLLAATLLEGPTIFADPAAARANQGSHAALRAFFRSLRDQMPEVLPPSFSEALDLPPLDPQVRIPLFERFNEELYGGGGFKSVRSDLRIFGQYVANLRRTALVEDAERIDWRLGKDGRLAFAAVRDLGPVTGAICSKPLEVLKGFREHLKGRADCSKSHKKKLFYAARHLTIWGATEGFIAARPEALKALLFDQPTKTVRVKPRARKDETVKAGKLQRVGQASAKTLAPNDSQLRAQLIRAQAEVVGALVAHPPKSVLLGDLLNAHTRDLDLKKGTLLSRSVNRSTLYRLEPTVLEAVENHLKRLKKSPYNRSSPAQYEGPLFIDNRGDSVLSCNVPAKERQAILGLEWVRMGLNLGHTIYREALAAGVGSASLQDVLSADVADVRDQGGSYSAIKIRSESGEERGAAGLSRETSVQLRAFMELTRASNLGGLWEPFNSRRPLFMSLDGSALLESLPGAVAKR